LNHNGYGPRHIDTILLTHYHADHTAGLPGLLLTMAKAGRTEPVDLYGPKGLVEIVEGVKMIARYIPFELRCNEWKQRENTIEIAGMKITAFSLKHSVPCLGYSFVFERSPKFAVEKAKALGLPVQMWGLLQRGETIEFAGNTYEPDMVMGEKRKGIHFVYATDTRPVAAIGNHAQDCDLLIAEGMYGDKEKMENALENRHMMMQEAAEIAASANVKELWLTHYSPSMHFPHDYEAELKECFARTVICDDGMSADLSFS